ncbi:MAG: lysoplasmalogenase family protein, partial [Pseudomonadota bacterium]
MAALSVGLLIWLRKGLGAMRLPVALYSLVISVMVAGGVAHWSAAQNADSAALAIAAAGFALSDVSVARDQFGGAGFANKAWGLPLYFAAQCLFAISV